MWWCSKAFGVFVLVFHANFPPREQLPTCQSLAFKGEFGDFFCHGFWNDYKVLVPVLAVFMGWDKLGGRKEVLPNASLSIMALTCVIYGRRSRAPQVKLQCVAISQRGRRRCDEGSRELRLYLSRWCFGEVCVACRCSTQLYKRANHGPNSVLRSHEWWAERIEHGPFLAR